MQIAGHGGEVSNARLVESFLPFLSDLGNSEGQQDNVWHDFFATQALVDKIFQLVLRSKKKLIAHAKAIDDHIGNSMTEEGAVLSSRRRVDYHRADFSFRAVSEEILHVR